MKKNIKNLMPAYVIAFVACFMILIYEPIFMYATNINDIWFDIYMMTPPMLLIFLIVLIFISITYTAIYFINKHFSKDLKFYKIILLISTGLLIILYIQGNFLINNLPALDGKIIDYSIYKLDNYISLAVYLIVIISLIVVCKKFKIERTIKGCTFIVGVIFCMLFVSLISTSLTTDKMFGKKENIPIVTNDNINNISTDKNFLIFLVDTIDSRTFYKALENSPEFKETFTDFTYYPDALSGYTCTRDSIPFIFSGIWNENKTDFETYSSNAYSNSTFLKNLQKSGYNINLYESELIWNGERNINIENLDTSNKVKLIPFLKQEGKYILFKYLPYNLKKYSRIENLNFLKCSDKYVDGATSMEDVIEKYKGKTTYTGNNIANYNNLKNNQILNKQKQKYFQYVHIDGAHVPFEMDKNLNIIENGTYLDKVEASLTITDLYIKRLKENNAYENSVIVVLADHGHFHSGKPDEPPAQYIERSNPMLLIKGLNENHEDMQISDKAISYEDLNGAFSDLLNDKQSSELFENIGNERKRRFLFYSWTKEDHMVEYEVTGKAWDISKFKATGREFNR